MISLSLRTYRPCSFTPQCPFKSRHITLLNRVKLFSSCYSALLQCHNVTVTHVIKSWSLTSLSPCQSRHTVTHGTLPVSKLRHYHSGHTALATRAVSNNHCHVLSKCEWTRRDNSIAMSQSPTSLHTITNDTLSLLTSVILSTKTDIGRLSDN